MAVSLRLSMHLLPECSLAEFPARNAPQPSALPLGPRLCARGWQSLPKRCLGVRTATKGEHKNNYYVLKECGLLLCYDILLYSAVLHFQIRSPPCCKHAQMECRGLRAEWEQLPEDSAGCTEDPSGDLCLPSASPLTECATLSEPLPPLYFRILKRKGFPTDDSYKNGGNYSIRNKFKR